MCYVLALFWPGISVPVFTVHAIKPGDLLDWEEEDLKFIVEEGRRQLDRQLTQLDRVQNRAQFLFTTALGLSVLLVATVRNAVRDHGVALLIGSYVGLILVVLGLLGAAALMSTRAAYGGPETASMTLERPPVLPRLAEAYATRIGIGENTLATRVTVFRDAVFLVLLGAVIHGVIWLVRV